MPWHSTEQDNKNASNDDVTQEIQGFLTYKNKHNRAKDIVQC